MTSILSTKRLVLSTIVALISSGTLAANVRAYPEVDPSFNLQQTRLHERDIRNGVANSDWAPAESVVDEHGYGAETNYGASTNSSQTVEAEESQEQLSLAERRRQSAAQRNK